MGSRMAANAVRGGHGLTVWNRTAATAEAFAAEHDGVRVASSPQEAADGAELLFTNVVDDAQVAAVLEQVDAPGVTCVDCSTIGVQAARAIAADVEARGMRFVDAPVTGSAPRAADATLTIMAGGASEDVERARPVLETMGSTVLHVGPLGHGQAIKLINNSVAAANAHVVAQALAVGRAMELDLDALVAVVGSGSGASAMLELKGGVMRERDWTPLFKLEHMLKDVRLCLDEGQAAGVGFPAAASVREVLSAAMGRGLGEQDFAALAEVVDAAS